MSYTINSNTIVLDSNLDPIEAQNRSIEITLDTPSPFFSYTINETIDDEFSVVFFDNLEGVSHFDEIEITDEIAIAGFVYTAEWDGNETSILEFLVVDIFDDDAYVYQFMTYLTGDALPSINSIQEYEDFLDSITHLTNTLPIGFREGDEIEFAAIGATLIDTAVPPATATSGDDTVVLTDEDDTFDGLAGGDSITAGSGNDNINGGNGADTILGGNGRDEISGDNGNDTLSGNNGADTILGGNGADEISGDNGNDTLSGGNGADTLNGGNGRDKLSGNNGNDTLNGGNGNDRLSGQQGNDILTGGNGQDRLLGNNGNDTLIGGKGGDTLYAGKGDDILFGNNGNDVLFGEEGNNILTGGSGADLFIFENTQTTGRNDIITDLSSQDEIYLDNTRSGQAELVATDDSVVINLSLGSSITVEGTTDIDFVFDTLTFG